MKLGKVILVCVMCLGVAACGSAPKHFSITPTGTTSLDVTIKSKTSSSVTLQWTAAPDCLVGYAFMVNGVKVSTTSNCATTTVKFSAANCAQPLPNGCGVTTGAAGSSGVVSTAPVPVSTTTATTTSTTTTTNNTGNVIMSPTGNDATCVRGGSPCQSFDRADAIALSGDTITVMPGLYKPAPTQDYGAGTYISHGTPATYVCAPGAAANSVTFSDPVFVFNPNAANITMRGDCFHFHIVQGGLGGYPQNIIKNILLDGVHMDVFDLTGVQGFTIQNSQIGPIDACFGIGKAAAFGAPSSAECDPSNPTEAYWATIPTGTLNLQDEPYIHSNGSLNGVSLINNHFTGLQTKWPAVFHQGGLLLWDCNGCLIQGNTFDHNAVYDIEWNAGYHGVGMNMQQNILGPAYDAIRTNGVAPTQLPDSSCQEGMADPSGTSVFTNAIISNNAFSVCFNIGKVAPSWIPDVYTNVAFSNNTYGVSANCPVTSGVTYSNNTLNGNVVCG